MYLHHRHYMAAAAAGHRGGEFHPPRVSPSSGLQYLPCTMRDAYRVDNCQPDTKSNGATAGAGRLLAVSGGAAYPLAARRRFALDLVHWPWLQPRSAGRSPGNRYNPAFGARSTASSAATVEGTRRRGGWGQMASGGTVQRSGRSAVATPHLMIRWSYPTRRCAGGGR